MASAGSSAASATYYHTHTRRTLFIIGPRPRHATQAQPSAAVVACQFFISFHSGQKKNYKMGWSILSVYITLAIGQNTK